MKEITRVFIIIGMVICSACTSQTVNIEHDENRITLKYQENGHVALDADEAIVKCKTSPLDDIDLKDLRGVLGDCEGLLKGQQEISRQAHIIIRSLGSHCTTTIDPVSGNVSQQCHCNGKKATLIGTQGDDNLVGTSTKANVIVGGGGNDTIHGGGKDDTICGGSGNDKLYGEGGKDNLFGWIGDDELYGGDGNDKLHGEDGLDKLFGGGGNDELYGWLGDDELYGENGKDKLDGGDGGDDCDGGPQKDTGIGCENLTSIP